MSLDLAVSRALRGALVMERAVATSQGWSFAIGGLSIPAVRELDASGVTFHAATPDLPFTEFPEVMALRHHECDQLVRPLGTDEIFTDQRELVWRLELDEVARI
jgi:hypothetical protein